MQKNDQPAVILYDGKEYENIGDIPLGSTLSGEAKVIEFMILNKGLLPLVKFDYQTNMPRDAYEVILPERIEPLHRASAKLTLLGHRLIAFDPNIKTIIQDIIYHEERTF